MAIDRDEALAIQRRAMRDFVAMLGCSAPGSELRERDGVVAARVPRAPQRSIANSVSYGDSQALLEAHPELERFYAGGGVEAWTVWVPDCERETVVVLEARGHRFDGDPCAMTLELAGWRGPGLGDLDWDAEASPAVLGPLNDRAYGFTPDAGLAPALAEPRLEGLRVYAARVAGEPACALATIDHAGEDLGFYFVATHPGHRSRGLATRLMSAAIEEAIGRGLRTASLQSSAMGQPVYERLGFQAQFRFELYERRAGAAP